MAVGGNVGGAAMGDDEFTLMLVGIFAWPMLAGVAYWGWSQGGTWLVKHQILVSAKAGPLLTIPGMADAGLDSARLTIVVGLIALAVVASVAGIRRAIAARRAQMGGQ